MDEKGDEMAKMTVYHGGYMAVEHPEIRKGRNTKDFGTGFYCTIIKEQAQRWAKRYDTKIVSIYDVRLDSSLKIKDFREMTDEWLDFIIDCRAGKTHNYDIVIGAMADDQIYNYISDLYGWLDYERAVLGAGKVQISDTSDKFLLKRSTEMSGIQGI